MATRDASLRLRLDTGQFTNELRRGGDEVRREAARMGHSLKHELGEGFHHGVEAVHELGHKMRELLGLASAIGGGLGLAEMIHHAVEAQDVAGRVAMKLRALGDEQAHAGRVMAQAVEWSKKFALTTDEALHSYEGLIDRTGDPVFSGEAIGSVGLMANAFHATAENATAVVAMFRKGLGASADQIENDFAPALHGTLIKAGITLEQFAPHAQDLGALMYRSNMKGVDGLKQMIGLLGVAKDKGGDAEQRIMGVRTVLDKLGNKQAVKMFGKEAGIDVAPLLRMHGAMERLHAMMGDQKSMKALEGLFLRGGMKSFFEGLSAPLQLAHDAVLAAHGLKENATPNEAIAKAADAAGLKAWDEALRKASESEMTAEKLREEAAETAKETGRNLQLAFNRMAAAFENEKFLGALNRLADVMPKVADVFGNIVDAAIDNPAVAAGGIVGLTFLKGALPGFLGSALKSVPGALGGGNVAGAAAAEAFGSAKIGAAIGVAANATMLLGAAAVGAYVGDQINQRIVQPGQKAEFGSRRDAELAASDAAVALGSKDFEKKKRVLEEIKQARASIQKNASGFVNGLDTVVAMSSGQATPETVRKRNLAELADAEAKLRAQIDERVAAERRAVAELQKQTTATRGVNPPPAPVPGAAPPRK